MAAFNFPNSPSTNDTHTENGITFQWNGTVWKKLTGPSDAASVVPTGTIVMYNGDTAPSGWALCDGGGGRPDLRDKFVVGSGGSYSRGATGGSQNITLSTSQIPSHTHGDGNYSTSNTGAHSHSLSGASLSGNTSNTGSHTHSLCMGDDDSQNVTTLGNTTTDQNCGGFNTEAAGNHSHSISGNISGNTNNTGAHSHDVTGSSGSAGGGSSFDNRPPYYALCYIIKT